MSDSQTQAAIQRPRQRSGRALRLRTLVLLDGQREEVDLLQALDLALSTAKKERQSAPLPGAVAGLRARGARRGAPEPKPYALNDRGVAGAGCRHAGRGVGGPAGGASPSGPAPADGRRPGPVTATRHVAAPPNPCQGLAAATTRRCSGGCVPGERGCDARARDRRCGGRGRGRRSGEHDSRAATRRALGGGATARGAHAAAPHARLALAEAAQTQHAAGAASGAAVRAPRSTVAAQTCGVRISAHLLHQAAELGGRHPRLVLVLLGRAARATAAVAAPAVTASTVTLAAAAAEAAGEPSAIAAAVSHGAARAADA